MTAALDISLPWPQGHVSGPDNGPSDVPIRVVRFMLDAEPVGAAKGMIYLDDLGAGEAPAPSATRPPDSGAATLQSNPAATTGVGLGGPYPLSERQACMW